MVLPEGIVEHRAPEVLRSVHAAALAHEDIRTAFFEPLHLFVRDSRDRDRINDRVTEGIEDTLTEDDRPYVGEWIKAQGDIRWDQKDAAYWKVLLKRADQESRLPDHEMIRRHRPISRRTRDQTWWRAMGAYTEEWRFPAAVHGAYNAFKSPSDWVRQVRYIERGTVTGDFPRMVKDNLDVRYGAKVAKVLGERIRLMTKEFGCVDNVRVAARDNKAEMAHYRWQKGSGCCAYQDIEIDVLGRPFVIGCNYGH